MRWEFQRELAHAKGYFSANCGLPGKDATVSDFDFAIRHKQLAIGNIHPQLSLPQVRVSYTHRRTP